MRNLTIPLVPSIVVAFLLGQIGFAVAQDGDKLTPPAFERDLFQQTVQSGVQYLLEKGQAEDGSFSKQLSPAVTAMCTSSLLEHGIPLSHPKVQKAISYLESLVQPDGGIYPAGSTLRNYETSVAVMCFQRAKELAEKSGDAESAAKYHKVVGRAVAFLKGLQWDDSEGHPIESQFYGGQGYGSHKRPDASNTSYFLDALEAAGEDGESEAVQKALVFMSRCQNLPTAYNTAEWASKVSDEDRGGGIYTAVGQGGESMAGQTPNGGLRSYASMTYAGLKSFLYAGLSKDDIRVKAAFDWISRHYDVKTNPGMGQQGLFYYYHVFAKTLHAVNETMVTDSKGQQHHWRNDLIKQLADRQQEDGSWTNPADRWYEGDPNLVTSYALLALSYCKEPVAAESPQATPDN
jgi:squalene-hopene/tetraprenyl-beta-curcumene cyclase